MKTDDVDAGVNGSAVPDEAARLGSELNYGGVDALYQNPIFLYIAVACFTLFIVVLCVAIWRYKTPKL